VAEHAAALRTGRVPTALALSVLDVKQPADWEGEPEVTEHSVLAHYLLDGHRRINAAAREGLPTRLLALLALDLCGASEEQVERLLRVLAT
jgi:hypothetical protein